jgi:virginiamycin B lyase
MRVAIAGFAALLLSQTVASALPQGEGESLVREHCSSCHRPEILERAQGYNTTSEWRELMATMVALDEPRADLIARYLAKHFQSKPELYPTLVPGPVNIEIEEWLVPTLGQRSRDPVEGLDGSIWWTGMWASLVGRLDPLTGDVREYPLPPSARPHSIVPDNEGFIWYLGNSNGTVGKLNPLTGDIREYDTGLADPHTGVFHPNGYFYFTAQRAGAVARLDPASGEVLTVNTCPRPYGIKVGPDGYLYVAFNGENAIGQVDPATLEVNYFAIPHEDSRIRRLDIASDGTIWYVNSSRGKIGHLDPKTGAVREWDSPSGPKSHPYAIAVIDDVVWYNESGQRPDALVRFDPETEAFQSWAIPSGIGIIRHVWVTRDKDLLIHQSSSNRIGRVKVVDAQDEAANTDPIPAVAGDA